MMPPSWSYGIDGSSLLTMVVGVLLGATLGTIIGTEIAYRRTEKWLKKLLTRKETRDLVVSFMKRTFQQFEDEYIKPKLESEEFKEMIRKAKKQAIDALFERNVPRLSEYLGGDNK